MARSCAFDKSTGGAEFLSATQLATLLVWALYEASLRAWKEASVRKKTGRSGVDWAGWYA